MDVHPPKNGMYRYWSIAIWEQDLVRSELHGPENWSPNPMMCPHDARLRWRLDLTCGSCLVKYDTWGFKYGSHPTKILKMLKSQKIPIHSYSILFINGRIHGLPCGHWLSRLVSLVSAGWFSLGTSTPWYLGQNRNRGPTAIEKKHL